MPTLTELPPRYLIPHERNLRTDVGDVADLMASITAVGILQPLLVVPLPQDEHPPTEPGTGDGDQPAAWYQIIVGHRRHAAAVHLGLDTVPCLVATDEGEARRVVIMLSENVHRIGLSPTEEANAYRQLTLLDWTPEQISAVTAKPAERVRHALTLVTLPPQVRQAADQGDLDLAEAAALADFSQDPKVLDRILSRGRGWGFTHAVAEERSKIERREAAERAKAELVLAGVRVTARPKDYGYSSREVEASTLLDSAGNRLDPDAVKARPGFAAFVDAAVTPPRVVVYCTDPEAWGYTRTRPTSYVSEAAAAQRAREQTERQARAQALAVAASVRRDFLAVTYGTAKGAKAVHLDAWRAAMTDPASITVTEAMVPLLARLAGCDPDAAAGAGPDRLTRVLVARWLTVAETNLDRLIARHWQVSAPDALAYLDRLTAAGYVLSDAETGLRTDLTEQIAAEQDDDDSDEGDEPEEDEEPQDDEGSGQDDDHSREDVDPGEQPSGTGRPDTDQVPAAYADVSA
jgi:ParB family chromosome partitioning protein